MPSDEAAALPLARGLLCPGETSKVVILRRTADGSYHLIAVTVDGASADGAEPWQVSLDAYMKHVSGMGALVAEKVTFSLSPPYDERKYTQTYRINVRTSSRISQNKVSCTSPAFKKLALEIAFAKNKTKRAKKEKSSTAPTAGLLITALPQLKPQHPSWLPRILEAIKLGKESRKDVRIEEGAIELGL